MPPMFLFEDETGIKLIIIIIIIIIQWIESYLTGSSQFVQYNGVTSKTVPVTSGVPQGVVVVV